MLDSGIYADYVVIGEPTMLDIGIAHRGVNRYQVTIEGQAGHASAPQCSKNPLYAGAKIVTAVESLQETLQQKNHPILPSPSIAATIFTGGVQGNAVPQLCNIVVDRRTIPGETDAWIQNEIAALIAPVQQRYPAYQFQVTGIAQIPPCVLHADAKLPSIGKRALHTMGKDAVIRDFPAGCDLYQFVEKGMEAILVGPGSLAQAHTADEFIEIEQLMHGQTFYKQLIIDLLY